MNLFFFFCFFNLHLHDIYREIKKKSNLQETNKNNKNEDF